MLEVVVTIIFLMLIVSVQSFWFTMFLLILLIILILPGMYSMIFGAPYVSTTKKRLAAVIKLGNFKKSDVVYELGCGDGRIIRRVAEKGVKKAIGLEFSIPTYFLAKAKAAWFEGREKILFRNFWRMDLSKADVVICFLLDRTMKDFEDKIWPKLKKGARVISNEFRLEKVEPDESLDMVYLYVKK